MEVEPLEASPEIYIPMGGTPVEAERIEETPAGKEAPVGGVARGDAGRGVARVENARERRPEPVKNVVERQIGGKTFRLG